MFSRPIPLSFRHSLQTILLAFRIWRAQMKLGLSVSELDYLGLL